ncbi:LptF/LptG family permease [Candidatus Magnetobacterium casense]|uniref:LptF/LptG family permease n=1 Tax=Candidatus Magnetobacterium casense TaxID=1455061 RepID=UPI0020FFF93B|nr:LptF/LptG family permease [Candidatus Magnetobacterium casensis]
MRELLWSLLLSLAAFNVVLMMERVLKYSLILSGVGASTLDFLEIIMYVQPQLSLLTMPMSFMTAVLFTYGRLNVDSEIVILRAVGMSFGQIARPVLILGWMCFLLVGYTAFVISPASSKTFRSRLIQIIATKSPMAIEQGVFYTLIKDVVVLVKEKRSATSIRDIFIYDKRNKKNSWVIFAKEGNITTYDNMSVGFTLKKGEIFLPSAQTLTKLTFDTYNMTVSMMPQVNFSVSELTPSELLQRAEGRQGEERLQLYIEFHRRCTLPLMVLVLSILSPALAHLLGKGGRLAGLSIAMTIFVLYYGLLVYCEKLIRNGKLVHFPGAWIPLALTLGLSLYLYGRAHRR